MKQFSSTHIVSTVRRLTMVRHIPLQICSKNPTDGLKQLIRNVRPHWNVDNVNYRFYDKGKVNTLISCHAETRSNDAIVVKICRHEMSSFVNRKAEILGNQLINKRGYAAEVVAIFQNGFCYSFLDGETLDIDLVNQKNIWKNVARGLAVIHSTNAQNEIPEKSNTFQILYKYVNILPDNLPDPIKNQRYKSLFPTKENLREEVKFLETYLNDVPSPIVYCHGDPRLENILWDSEKRKIMFLDFEYAGFNNQAYDIAAHFVSYAGLNDRPNFDLCPDKESQCEWLREYLKHFATKSRKIKISRKEVEELYDQVQKYSLATHMMMVISGILGSALSTLEFDLFEHGVKRAEEYFKQKNKLLNLEK